MDVLDWVKKVQDLGAGEIMLTSIDMEGIKKGFDIVFYIFIIFVYLSMQLISYFLFIAIHLNFDAMLKTFQKPKGILFTLLRNR